MQRKPIKWVITYQNNKFAPETEIRSPHIFLFSGDSKYLPDKTPFTITPIFEELE